MDGKQTCPAPVRQPTLCHSQHVLVQLQAIEAPIRKLSALSLPARLSLCYVAGADSGFWFRRLRDAVSHVLAICTCSFLGVPGFRVPPDCRVSDVLHAAANGLAVN